jgi:hypothetical protein
LNAEVVTSGNAGEARKKRRASGFDGSNDPMMAGFTGALRLPALHFWPPASSAGPNNQADHQIALFEKAPEAFAVMNDDLVNKVMEVLADGSVHVREWNADDHDIGHISNPDWK